MIAKDLREYLDYLNSTNQLIKISDPIDTLDEMGAIIAKADYAGIEAALLFENPKGFDIPVLANTIGSTQKRIAEVFGISKGPLVPQVAQKMGQLIQGGGISPVAVENRKAPCKEIILTGEAANLALLPILRLNPSDGGEAPSTEGRFITSVACSNPTPGSHNLSYHRFEVLGAHHGTAWIFRLTGDAKSMEESWGHEADPSGKPFPMAFAFGLPPEYLLTAANPALPYKYDDFSFIGGLTGKPVEMVRCETIAVDVPAHSEIVVEGIFRPYNFGRQGAFASFNGCYDTPRRRPIFEITAITMRKNPIYQHVHIGLPLCECNNIAAFFRGVKVFVELKAVLANVRDVFVDPVAGCGFTVHVSIKKTRIGEPKMAMMRAYTALGGFCKHVFVYDEDINIHDSREREWALAHRFMADRDLLIIPNVMGMDIDPMAQGHLGSPAKLGVYDGADEIPLNVRTFMGVDCTIPKALNKLERVVIPAELENRVDSIWQKIKNGS